jgi:uncharacterized protein (DUF58 family)
VTGRGWAILTGALISLLAGRLLGLEDLYLVGAGLLLAMAFAAVYLQVVRPDVTATRRVLPARVHAGASSRVELSLVNRSPHRSAVLSVRDPFDDGARWARFLVAPLGPGELARAAYRLPTEQRGVFDLGPLRVSLTDPFGVMTATVEAAPRTRLTVYPRIDPVAPPPSSHGDDPLAGADHPRALTGGGEDFYALRPYVRGDDLRKVHWPSTAKADDLMIRQDEMPWQSRSTLLLDNRRSVCPGQSIEILVSAAASLVVAAARHDGLQRLITTSGYDSRTSGGTGHIDAILEHLAAVSPGDGPFLPALGSIRRSQIGGALVVLTTALATTADLQAIATLHARFASVTVVVVERSAWGDAVAPRPLPPGLNAVRVTGTTPFAAAWSAFAGPPAAPVPGSHSRTSEFVSHWHQG